jgi:hypothetical protein
MPGNRNPNKTKEKELSLLFPRSGDGIDTENFVFQWTPYKSGDRPLPVYYRLLVYRYKKGMPVSKALKGKPVYIADKLKNPYFKFTGPSGTFKEKDAYIWKVEVRDKEKRLVGRSEIQGFRYTPSRSLASDIKVLYPPLAGTSGGSISDLSGSISMRGADRFDLSSFIPAPPHVFGCPVKLRPLSQLPENEPPSPTPPPEEGEEPDPLGLIWGQEASRLYLVPSLCRHASVYWDYRYLDDCEQVLLQIADENGFEVPNAEDAMADPGACKSYIGLAFINSPSPCYYLLNPLIGLGGLPDTDAGDLNILIESHLRGLLQPRRYSEVSYIRLAPLDSERNQIGPASDHVAILPSSYPGIELSLFSVEWFWGENPYRRVFFELRLLGTFPCYPEYEVPITFVFWTGAGQYVDHILPDIIDNSFTESNGTPLSLTGTWWSRPAYFWTLNKWMRDARYAFYLEQTSESLVSFTDVNMNIECIPGISPHWRICEGSMLEDFRPRIGSTGNEECESPNLSIYIMNGALRGSTNYGYDGLASIYRLFTQHLTGRRVSSIDGEQHVTIEFVFSEPIANSSDFQSFLINHEAGSRTQKITMFETRDGTQHSYDFRLTGFHVGLLEQSTGRWYTGRVVFNPDRHRLGMHFDGLDYFLVVG